MVYIYNSGETVMMAYYLTVVMSSAGLAFKSMAWERKRTENNKCKIERKLVKLQSNRRTHPGSLTVSEKQRAQQSKSEHIFPNCEHKVFCVQDICFVTAELTDRDKFSHDVKHL